MTEFDRALNGLPTTHTPVVPKIWLDWAAVNGYFTAPQALKDPETAMLGLVRAAKDMRFDAVRLFLMPKRANELIGGVLCQTNESGKRLGAIDVSGGWATLFDNPSDFDLTNPQITMNPQSYAAKVSPIQTMEDIERICVPTADDYDDMGYGDIVEKAKAEAGDMALIGDCNCGTLSFYVALRGMMDAMTDMIDDPDMVCAAFDKGVQISLGRAAFFLRHGIKSLRYNDSSANMKLISPGMWREMIAPFLTSFCRAAHDMDEGARIYCHICGDVRPILPDLIKTGLDCIAPLDPMGGASVGEIHAAVGDKIALMGGVDTMLLLNGTPEEIKAVSQTCIREGGGRFILGSGCAVPRGVPKANLSAMVEAARSPS